MTLVLAVLVVWLFVATMLGLIAGPLLRRARPDDEAVAEWNDTRSALADARAR